MGKEAATVWAETSAVEQLPVEALPSQRWDVIIVGAGPAGSAAAIGLGELGYRVLLVDREWFPRGKVCGDCLTPGAMHILRRLDLYDDVQQAGWHSSRMSLFSPARVRIDVPGEFLTVRRDILDHIVARKALAVGVTFARGTALGVERLVGGGAEVAFREGSARHEARCCLLAVGGRLSLAHDAGLSLRPAASGAAVRCYVRSSLSIEGLVVACERDILPGYAWIFPVGEGLFNVGCGRFLFGCGDRHLNLGRVFRSFLEEFPLARDMMQRGEMVTPLQGAVLRSGWRDAGALARGPIMGLGEMVGTTSPYTGEGIGKAMKSGLLASRLVDRCLRKNDMTGLLRYPVYLGRLGGLCYEGFAQTRKWFVRPWLVDFVSHRINRSPYLHQSLQQVLQEKLDPGKVFSCRGVLRSFWR